jgi:hypothetical protein
VDQQQIEVLVKRVESLERRSRYIFAGLLSVAILLAFGAMSRRAFADDAPKIQNVSVEFFRRGVDEEKGVACYSWVNGNASTPLSCVKL